MCMHNASYRVSVSLAYWAGVAGALCVAIEVHSILGFKFQVSRLFLCTGQVLVDGTGASHTLKVPHMHVFGIHGWWHAVQAWIAPAPPVQPWSRAPAVRPVEPRPLQCAAPRSR